MLKVCNDKVIEMILVDHNDEMEMKVDDAKLAIRIDDDDDENTLANRRDIEVEVVPVPHSLSFYTIFYKMTMKEMDEEWRTEAVAVATEEDEEKEREEKTREIYLFCSVKGWAHAL